MAQEAHFGKFVFLSNANDKRYSDNRHGVVFSYKLGWDSDIQYRLYEKFPLRHYDFINRVKVFAHKEEKISTYYTLILIENLMTFLETTQKF